MSEVIAVLHGTLIDGTGAAPLPDSAVIIDAGRIEAAGPSADIDIPHGARTVEAAGKTLMPGLIEGHAHVGGNASAVRVLRFSLRRGITTIASVSANPPGIELRDAIEGGLVRGCSRLIAGCIVTPTNGHVKYRAADGPWEVRKAVREMVAAGADFIKTAASGGFWGEDENCSVRNYTAEELEALVDEAHAWERPVVVHAHTQPGLSNSIEAGVDQIHHGAFIDTEAVYGIYERGLYYMPTLRVTCDKNIHAWPDRPWMMDEMQQAQPIHREGVRTAHRIGVKIAVGTDYPGSSHAWEIGDATPWELQELVGCGLSPMQALVAATKTTAEAYRKGHELGTVEPGKKADLLVLRTNPLEDIARLLDVSAIDLVMKDGAVAYASEGYKQHICTRRV